MIPVKALLLYFGVLFDVSYEALWHITN